MRWENEGLFRSYKRTLAKGRPTGRAVRSAHREAYCSLLACQLLLAQTALALHPAGDRPRAAGPVSVRLAILEARAGLRAARR